MRVSKAVVHVALATVNPHITNRASKYMYVDRYTLCALALTNTSYTYAYSSTLGHKFIRTPHRTRSCSYAAKDGLPRGPTRTNRARRFPVGIILCTGLGRSIAYDPRTYTERKAALAPYHAINRQRSDCRSLHAIIRLVCISPYLENHGYT